MKAISIVLFLLTVSCVSSQESLYDAMKKDPVRFMDTLRDVAEAAQKQEATQQAKAQSERMSKDLKNPREVKIDVDRIIYGKADAPVTIVKYADFQCPACRMGFQTLEQIKKKYKDQVRVIHKNIPLPFHPQAKLAAEIYESMVILDKKLAAQFYHEAYEKLGEWNTDDKLWKLVKKIGINKEKVLAEIKKGEVERRLKEDSEEHTRLGFQGTPMYMINGVEFQGAPSFEQMSMIIDVVLKKK